MAAASYQWDNVANYDFTFRQLMEKFPQRSWAKNQMWCLSMKDLVQKGAFQSNNQFGQNRKQGVSSAAGNTSNPSNTSGGPPKKAKPNYCWAYNKGQCKDGSKCKFMNRCSYWDSADHARINCPKLVSSK